MLILLNIDGLFLWKTKTVITITNSQIPILWLRGNGIEVYLRHKEGKALVAKRFIRSLKNKICNYMNAKLKHVCIGKLDNIV